MLHPPTRTVRRQRLRIEAGRGTLPEVLFVLEGTLVTHAGRFGPGAFVWFPEGQVMEHGASPDGDAVVVFITNKPFRIDYR